MAYPLLLSPLRIGPVEIPNRIVSTAHQTTLVEDGLPTDDFVAYHAARAHGGAGLICIEATAVHPSGLLTGHTIAGYDPRVVERLARVAEAVHAGGGRLFAQLFHGGREQIDSPPRAPAVAPSAVPSQRFKVEPRALSSDEIEEIVAHHELVAGHARAAGLDGIELCASHGYLPTQFLSERSNRRDDAWGGDADRRMRYVREALLAMRRGAGAGLAVGIRLSADETLPEGRHAPETAAILRTLAGEGLIDYASAVIGDSASYLGAAWIVPPPPVSREAIREPAGVLRTGLSVPLIATSRIHEAIEAEALLVAGVADAIGMTRALIADPDLPRRLLEGREDDRILCTGCNQGCIGHYHLGLPISCLQNPRTGREARTPEPVPQAGSRVLVIGGGPA
ncbi:MAG: oxidoreductase, partial [Actinomycetota bacterium]|nr:oxidoreductase [Actinomycetota bacterium]